MYQSKRRTKATASLEILASVGLTLGLSSWAMGQDCGAGDFVSAEPCLVDGDSDTVNGGCNSDPDVFSEAAVVNGTISGTVSTYVTGGGDFRDTDWYLVSPAQLAAADIDGNGIVRLSHTGSSEMPVVLFIVGIGDPLCSGAAVLGVTGWAGPTCGDAGGASDHIIDIAGHPNGIVFYIAPGNPDGSSINTGFPCADGPGGFDYLIDLSITELPTACTFDGEPCNVAVGALGCNDPDCCAEVCELSSSCCEVEWDELCVLLATDPDFGIECAPGLGAPVFLATGPDSGADGYLDKFADGYGSEGDAFAGGPAWLDHYNAVGGGLSHPTFSSSTWLFSGADKQVLSLHDGIFSTYGGSTMSALFIEPNIVSDENKDGVNDQMIAHFEVTGPLTLDVVSTQSVESSVAEGGIPYATYTLSYEITNNGGAATIQVVRYIDADLLFVGGAGDDTVGTGTNLGPECDRYVYMSEVGAPNFGLTLSSNVETTEYVGSKLNFDPDCAGPAPPMGFGTDPNPIWNNGGLPVGYSNIVAGVGNDLDGDSGAAPVNECTTGDDGGIGLFSTIILGAGETTTVTFTHTYGAITPNAANCAGGEPCDADIDGDGSVGTTDLLILLAAWGTAGPGDIDGDGTVGTADLLILLAAWGPCP